MPVAKDIVGKPQGIGGNEWFSAELLVSECLGDIPLNSYSASHGN